MIQNSLTSKEVFKRAHEHLENHYYHVNSELNKFHLITMVSNPVRFSSRYNLFKKFEKQIREAGVKHFHVVEVQQGNRAFQVTDRNNPYHLQLRTNEILWIKENALNLGIQRMVTKFPACKYIAWVDADIEFARQDWLEETLNELQIYDFIQMFQTAVDLGFDRQAIHTSQGFVYSYLNNFPYKPHYGNWHSGYAWAAKKDKLSEVGLLIDKAILGSADRHMAMCLIGKGAESFNGKVSDNYKDMVISWEKRCNQFVKRNIGYVKGNIYHNWHGRKADRRYMDRWKILVDYQFDPYKHLSRDAQGLLQLDIDAYHMRDAIRRYFQSRNEDSIDLA